MNRILLYRKVYFTTERKHLQDFYKIAQQKLHLKTDPRFPTGLFLIGKISSAYAMVAGRSTTVVPNAEKVMDALAVTL